MGFLTIAWWWRIGFPSHWAITRRSGFAFLTTKWHVPVCLDNSKMIVGFEGWKVGLVGHAGLSWDTDFIGRGRNFPFPFILSVADRPTVWNSNTSKLARNICEKFNLVSSFQIAGKISVQCTTRVFGGVESHSRSQCFDDKQRDGRWPSTKDNKNIIFGRCVRFVNTHSRFG